METYKFSVTELYEELGEYKIGALSQFNANNLMGAVNQLLKTYADAADVRLYNIDTYIVSG